jgi:hypothetical protein
MLYYMSDSDDSTMASWTDDINGILLSLQDNSDQLQKMHKEKYLHYKGRLIVFRIPLIILSTVNSVFSVGLSQYTSQETTSTVNCFLSLLCAIISSVELFLAIHKKMEQALVSYHGYKLLCIKIAAQRRLSPENRQEDGHVFLTSVLNDYRNLFEGSNVLRSPLHDRMLANAITLSPLPGVQC